MSSRVVALAVALQAAFTCLSSAETIYDNQTNGTITFNESYICNTPGPDCLPCVGSSTTLGPVIHLGKTGFNGVSGCGTVTGTFSARARLDGVDVAAGLLPTGSFFRSKILVRHGFCPLQPTNPCWNCLCDVSVIINGTTYPVVRNDVVAIEIPTTGATGGNYRFEFCNHEITWGAGCNVGGSIDYRWVLHTPAPVRAALVAAGDSPPTSFAGTGITVDKRSGAGGVMTATRVDGPPPWTTGPLPGQAATTRLNVVPDYPEYWEVRSENAPGAIEADIRLQYDPTRLPPGVYEQNLLIWGIDLEADPDSCYLVPTSIDVITHTAIGTGLDRLDVFILSQTVPPTKTRNASWGKVKAIYR